MIAKIKIFEKKIIDLQEIFVDDYIHLAGDELSENCYSLKPSI